MDKTDLRKKAETFGALETLILSAHDKFFRVNSENHDHLDGEESVLYDPVIRYFTDDSLNAT